MKVLVACEESQRVCTIVMKKILLSLRMPDATLTDFPLNGQEWNRNRDVMTRMRSGTTERYWNFVIALI